MQNPPLQIHWARFLSAFIAAPLIVTLLTFWAFFPIYALFLGGPFYVLIGLPLLVWHLRRHSPEYIHIILLALVSQLAVIPIIGVISLSYGDASYLEAIPFFLMMGSIFGLLWSATFTLLYRLLIRNL